MPRPPSDKQARSLVEFEVTVHPEAFRRLFSLRSGGLLTLLRYALLALMVYLSLGFQLALPRFLPELQANPLVLTLAFIALRSEGALLPAAAALLLGLLLDVGLEMPPGGNAALLVAATAVVHLCAHAGGLRKLPQAWLAAAIAGLLSNGLYSLGAMIFLTGGLPAAARLALIPRCVLLGTLLAAVVYAPLLFATADWLLPARPAVQAPGPQNSHA